MYFNIKGYEIGIDEKTYIPFIKVCGAKISFELLEDARNILDREEFYKIVEMNYEPCVVKELKNIEIVSKT